MDKKIKSSENELKIISAEIQKQRSILDLKQEVNRETFLNIEAIQTKISAEQQNRELLLDNLKDAELEATEIQQHIRLIQERIQDSYNSSVPKKMIVDATEEQIELEIQKIQKV